jgi:hypothetical protein
MDFGDIEKELVERRSTVEKLAAKGGELLEGRVGHANEIDKGEQALTSFLDKQAASETK